MSIAWQYLDKRNAAINALKDYEGMQYILKHSSTEISVVKNHMFKIDSPQLTDMPRGSSDPRAKETRIVKHIDSLNVLKERYQRAQEFYEWFQPAWEELSEAERFTLSCFYTDVAEFHDPVGSVCDYFHIERSSAYKKKERALDHLTLLLYGE